MLTDLSRTLGAEAEAILLQDNVLSVTSPSVIERPHREELRHSLTVALLGADTLALAIALVGGQLADWAINNRPGPLDALASLIYLPVFIGVMACYDLYRRGQRRLVGSSFPDFSHLMHSLIVGALITLFVAAGFHRWLGLPNLDRSGAALFAAIALICVPQSRAGARWLVRKTTKTHSRTLIVGSGVVSRRVVDRLKRVDGVEVIGYVDDASNPEYGNDEVAPFLGSLADVPGVVRRHRIDQVIVAAFDPTAGQQLASVLRDLVAEVQISIVPGLLDLLTVRSNVDDLYGMPMIDVAPAARGAVDRFAKRSLDIAAATFGLILLAPVMALIAVAVVTTSRGPALFKQARTGRQGRDFRICKFRTMVADAEVIKDAGVNDVDGPLYKRKVDPRVTRVGSFLRKTSLDEIPQLINVLKGDMSLVGPRPFITSESAEIGGWAARRFDVRPGMTGLWQVSGRNDLEFEELCRLDHSYVASWSLWWDLRILWYTPSAVLRRQGAY